MDGIQESVLVSGEPIVTSDGHVIGYCDPRVLDFNTPWPISLDEPGAFAAKLDDVARREVEQMNVEGSFVEFLPSLDLLSGDLRQTCLEVVDQFYGRARIVQGLMALFQPPGPLTEFRKVRSIVPAAPALLRLEESLATHERRVASIEDWGATPPKYGPAMVTFGTGAQYTIPAASRPLVSATVAEASYRDSLLHEIWAARRAVERVTRMFGAPAAWVKNRDLAFLDSLYRAMERDDPDELEYWLWFMREHCIHPPRWLDNDSGWIQCGRVALLEAAGSWRAAESPIGAWRRAARNYAIQDEFPRRSDRLYGERCGPLNVEGRPGPLQISADVAAERTPEDAEDLIAAALGAIERHGNRELREYAYALQLAARATTTRDRIKAHAIATLGWGRAQAGRVDKRFRRLIRQQCADAGGREQLLPTGRSGSTPATGSGGIYRERLISGHWIYQHCPVVELPAGRRETPWSS